MRLRPRWHKVLRDLWGNKIRTILVVLSIAIGVFAIGMIIGTQVLLQEDLAVAWNGTNPSNATLYTDPFDEAFLHTISRLDGVSVAEGRRSVTLPIQVGPNEWKRMNVLVVDDFEAMQLHRITPVSGEWPPDEGLIVERASLSLLNAAVGDTAVVETAEGRQRTLTIDGLAHDINTAPVQFTAQPNGYISQETLDLLGHNAYFDELALQVEGDQTDKAHIEAIVDLVEAKVG
ncbi:MAG: ABC transporter permease, partial [Chloroflexi bacterium]|nr:ABC transporter permease [Chloroflexota bacterium]